MRHRKRGRRLGRSSSHRKAMMRNLASSLFLTERDAEYDENPPKVKGRVVTTLQKAKEVRSLVEKCITIARRSLPHLENAEQHATDASRNSDQWREWRKSDQWRQWADAMAPALAARRRTLKLLGDKEAVTILFDEIAPRFVDRDGGYTRVLKLAKPRLGDAGVQAILEFVGVHDRQIEKSTKPEFGDEEEAESAQSTASAEQAAAEEDAAEEASGEEYSEDSAPQEDAPQEDADDK